MKACALAFLCALTLAGTPCQQCHETISSAHSASPHANAMKPWAGSLMAQQAEGKTLRDRGGFAYSFLEGVFRVSREGDQREMPVAWLMGSGRKAQTPLLKSGSEWREARLSWYADNGRLGLSPGHPIAPPFDAQEGLGVPQTAASLGRCLGCHSSGEAQPGVQCLRCHGNAERHANSTDKPAKAVRPSASAQVAICAQCHRSPDREYRSKTPELEDPLSVRFATIGFTASACFKPAGQFACSSCHEPHTQSLRASVSTTCLECHATPRKSSCPKEKERCVTCHMRQATPAPHLTFTDHRIRVYAP